MSLTDLFNWYCRQMLDLLPVAWRGRDGGPADGSIFELCPGEPSAIAAVRLLLRRKGGETELGHFRLDEPGLQAMGRLPAPRKPVVLRLPPEMLLEREVVLPLAAERDPERVLAYEMDRNTPFRSDEVFWACSIERRDAVRGRLHMRLSAVPRIDLQPVLAALEQAAIPVAWLEATRVSGTARVIGLRAEPSDQPRGMPQAMLAAACALLTVTAAALPFVLQSVERNAIEQKLTELRPRVARAEALRRALQSKGAASDVFAAERARVGDVLEVIAKLTDILPDTTFLTDLSLHEGRLGLEGQSAAAARLIGALSTDTVIHSPVFAAPVTRLDNGANDQFSIRAEITR